MKGGQVWSYNPQSRTTDSKKGIIQRTELEEGAERLLNSGFSYMAVTDALTALSSLSRKEVEFNVDLVWKERK